MLKRFLYRDTPEMVALVVLGVLCFPLVFVVETYVVILLLIIIVLCTGIFYEWNKKDNEKNHFLWCKRSIFLKNKIWIVQSVHRIEECKNLCPQFEFAKEMKNLLTNIPNGTECYCCTHEKIKELIEKQYPNAQITKVYKKDIQRLKKKIKTGRCEKCKKLNDCTINDKEQAQFYAIKFIKS